MIHAQAPFQGRNAALVAILAFADAAGNADRVKSARAVHAIGINQSIGMVDLAPQAKRVAAHRCVKRPAALGYRDRQAEILHAVRGFRQLAQKATRCFKRAMHIPQRAGPAEARELQARGRVALCDRARLVHTDEEERHSLGSGALQRGQPMRDLLQGCAELVGQRFQIMTAGLRRRQETPVG